MRLRFFVIFRLLEEGEPIEIRDQNLPNCSISDEHIETPEQNLPNCSTSEVELIENQEQNLPKRSICEGKFGTTEKLKRRLEPEDSCFALKHPMCVIKLTPDSISKNRLCVPVKFSRESGLYPRSCSIIMKDEDANSWEAELLYDSLSKRFVIGAGWAVFRSDHKLKSGDSLIIELIKKEETPVFKILKASCFKHPICVIKISPATVMKHILSVPSKFAREIGLNRRNCAAILQNEDGDSWTARLLYNSERQRYYIGSGWGVFHTYHKLKAGDSLMVELIKNVETPVFKMHKIQDRQNNNKQAGSCSVIKKRFFVAKVTPITCNSSYLEIPLLFSKLHLRNNKYEDVILRDEEGRSWPAKLCRKFSNDKVHIADGWIEFCVGNKLESGDSFVFEFIETEKRPIFKMSGFRTFTGKNREDASPHFYVNMLLSSYNRAHRMRVPQNFAREQGLADRRHSSVKITNENQKSWQVSVTRQKNNHVFMKSGWIRFVKENCIGEEDVLLLELVKGGTKLHMKCYTLRKEMKSN